MISIPGYEFSSQIHDGKRSVIYRGRRKLDNLPVIVKTMKNLYPSLSETLRFQQEFSMLHNLSSYSVVRAYKMEPIGNRTGIVMEDFGGHSLDRCFQFANSDLTETMILFVRIAEILDDIHKQRVIHKDINPTNIVWNRQTGQVKFIDFGISSNALMENMEVKPPEVVEGTLAYVSPEQTGRMNRAIDYRSDLYSLGVTFYQLLTDRLPFETQDPMELIYAHLAKIPKEPGVLNPQVPEMLSRIVLKLMAKNAEDRYQSAFGLKIDLSACLESYQSQGFIPFFDIALTDTPDFFHIPQKVFGRREETDTLLSAYDRVSQDGRELILVTGQPGIGKSALVGEISRPVIDGGGFYISGKFDPFKRDIPYAPLIRAFQKLILLLLSESPEAVANWKERLIYALEPNARIIIDVIPELALIIGEQPPVPELPAIEARNRFNLVFQQFVGVFARSGHPLVIFLDDLQWVDLPTIKLIELLLTGPVDQYLLLICAYRDTDVDDTHPFGRMLTSIETEPTPVTAVHLEPLTDADVRQLIAETLKLDDKSVAELSGLCLDKTQGNPFFLNQFLMLLHEEGIISFDAGNRRWRYDIESVGRLRITDNVVDFMVKKIERLPKKTLQMLKNAACIGNQFDLNILSRVNSMPAADTEDELWISLKEGLIIPHENRTMTDETGRETHRVSYMFSHDRIHQAVYSLMDLTEQQRLHLQIGRVMLAAKQTDSTVRNLFEIVNHLNAGKELIADDREKERLAELNHEAGIRAKSSAAYESAFYFFNSGINMLHPQSWKDRYLLTLNLYTEATEAAYLNMDLIHLERYSEIVLKKAVSTIDRVKIYEVKTRSYIAQNRLMDAVRTSLYALKLLGIKLPIKPRTPDILAGLMATKLRMYRKRNRDLIRRAPMSDPLKIAAMRILLVASSPAFFAVPKLLPLISFQQIRLSLKYGNALETPVAMAVFGLIECGVTGNIDAGYNYGQIAMQLVRHLDAREYEAKTILIYNSQIRHWKVHAKETLPQLLEAYQIGLETGDLEYAAYGIHIHCCNSYCIGRNLVSLERNMVSYSAAIRRLNQKTAYYFQQIWHQSLLNLRFGGENRERLAGDIYDEEKMLPRHIEANDRTALFDLYLHKLILCYFFGNYADAVAHSELSEKYSDGVTGMLYVPFLYFYSCLALLALCRKVPKKDQKRLLKRVDRLKGKMEKWASHCPQNFLHKYELIEAECADIHGDESRARGYYKKAIRTAAQNEYLNERAIANECFGRFWLDKNEPLMAQQYLSKARNQYMIWGATAKAQDMDIRYADLLEQQSENLPALKSTVATTSSTRAVAGGIDSISVLKASQAISGEIHLGSLLKKLIQLVIENAGAQKGMLLLKREADFYVEAVKLGEDSEATVLNGIPIQSAEVPEPIIRFVERTHETVVFDDAANEEMYANDPYILREKPKSVLCMPIVHQKYLVAILYVENNLIYGAFTRQRLESIGVIASQAAISLENALLYDDLRRAESKLRTLIKTANEGFVELNNDAYITDVNPEMCAILGMSHPQLIGRNILTTLDLENAEVFRRELALRREGKRSAYEITFIRPDNTRVHCLIKAIPLFEDSKQVGSYAMVTDITNRKKAEEEIRKLNEQLEARVRERTAELEQSIRTLKDAQKQLVESEKMASLGGLVAGVAHEVNTPVGVAVTAASFLNEKTVEIGAQLDNELPSRSTLEKYFKTSIDCTTLILANLQRAADLVRSFKQVAVDQSAEERRRFNVKQYMDEILMSMHPKFKRTQHTVVINCPEEVEIDSYPGAFAQIVTNLMMNSLIHGFDGIEKGEIRMDVTSDVRGIHFAYRDNGRGMSPEVRAQIFEPFFTTRRSQGGTGLGMHVVYNLVTQTLGGVINCTSRIKEGTTFTIFLPHLKSASHMQPREHPDEPAPV